MSILFIYGPRGCGKTTNGERFRKHYGKELVYEEAQFDDNTTKQLNRCIVLCNDRPDEVILNVFNAEAISFADAMKASETE